MAEKKLNIPCSTPKCYQHKGDNPLGLCDDCSKSYSQRCESCYWIKVPVEMQETEEGKSVCTTCWENGKKKGLCCPVKGCPSKRSLRALGTCKNHKGCRQCEVCLHVSPNVAREEALDMTLCRECSIGMQRVNKKTENFPSAEELRDAVGERAKGKLKKKTKKRRDEDSWSDSESESGSDSDSESDSGSDSEEEVSDDSESDEEREDRERRER